jgi:hypothetical protein
MAPVLNLTPYLEHLLNSREQKHLLAIGSQAMFLDPLFRVMNPLHRTSSTPPRVIPPTCSTTLLQALVGDVPPARSTQLTGFESNFWTHARARLTKPLVARSLIHLKVFLPPDLGAEEGGRNRAPEKRILLPAKIEGRARLEAPKDIGLTLTSRDPRKTTVLTLRKNPLLQAPHFHLARRAIIPQEPVSFFLSCQESR